MTRIERKLLMQTSVIGVLLTLVVTLGDFAGGLAFLERWLYDRRARDNQRFMAKATDKLIHIDIDDPALEEIGRFPWKRTTFALIIDELHRAGAKAIALDILFAEPEALGGQKLADGSQVVIDHDGNLAAAVQRAGNVLLPLAFNVLKTPPPSYRLMVDALVGNLEQSAQQAGDRIRTGGAKLSGDFDLELKQWFLPARREAMYRRINQELDGGDRTFAQLRSRLLPGVDTVVTGSPELNVLRKQLAKSRAMRLLDRFAYQPDADTPQVAPAFEALPPIRRLSQYVASTAFVDYMPDADGVVRSMPLWVNHRGRLYPQLGFALACMMLDVDIHDVKLTSGWIIIPRKNANDIAIPVHSRYADELRQRVALIMDVPWLGPANNWSVMYDPLRKDSVNHLPITKVWALHVTREKIKANNANLDDAMLALLELLDKPKADLYARNRPPLEDMEGRGQMLQWIGSEVVTAGFDELETMDVEGLGIRYQKGKEAIKAIRTLPTQQQQLSDQLAMQMAELRSRVVGRAAIVGWTATGAIADFVPTTLHFRCPGPVIHGVLLNGILTGELWRRMPSWVTLGVTMLVGLLATATVAWFSPKWSLTVSLALAGGYLVFNGVVLFDLNNIILGAAGPMVSVAVVWSGCTLYRFIIERAERARITKRFRSYVDPALVDWVIEHPEQASLTGQTGELTVVFTDLAGFTSLSEKLREKTVGILNEYMELMVPIIREHNGYVNKFLGDGIMFFYGAPRSNAYHAKDAVLTAMKMQQVMPEFNRQLESRNLPRLAMRVGISSGNMVVGDAGSTDASDYTVLGDAVNLGARLESANKATGTWILMNDRAAMLVQDMFLLAPIGRLQVVGKSQGIMTYTPVCQLEQVTAEQQRFVDMSNDMVNAYIVSDFEKCIENARKVEAAFESTKLTRMYIEVARRYMHEAIPLDFIGQIVLEEK